MEPTIIVVHSITMSESWPDSEDFVTKELEEMRLYQVERDALEGDRKSVV